MKRGPVPVGAHAFQGAGGQAQEIGGLIGHEEFLPGWFYRIAPRLPLSRFICGCADTILNYLSLHVLISVYVLYRAAA